MAENSLTVDRGSK